MQCAICQHNRVEAEDTTCDECSQRVSTVREVYNDGIWICTKEKPCCVCQYINDSCVEAGYEKPIRVSVMPYCERLDGKVVMVCRTQDESVYSHYWRPIFRVCPCYVIAAKKMISWAFGVSIPYDNLIPCDRTFTCITTVRCDRMVIFSPRFSTKVFDWVGAIVASRCFQHKEQPRVVFALATEQTFRVLYHQFAVVSPQAIYVARVIVRMVNSNVATLVPHKKPKKARRKYSPY